MLYVMTLAAVAAGMVVPLRWRVWGFLGAVAALFIAQAGASTAWGYGGLSLEESMLFFNNSWASYVGYNLQITYRSFALPLGVLAAVFVFRLGRR